MCKWKFEAVRDLTFQELEIHAVRLFKEFQQIIALLRDVNNLSDKLETGMRYKLEVSSIDMKLLENDKNLIIKIENISNLEMILAELISIKSELIVETKDDIEECFYFGYRTDQESGDQLDYCNYRNEFISSCDGCDVGLDKGGGNNE